MKKKNRKKFIILGISVSLLASIGISAIYFQEDERKNLYQNLSESIITKQPNLKSLLSEKQIETEINIEDIKNLTSNVSQEDKTMKDNNSNSSNQNNTKTVSNKNSNVTSNKVSNKTSNKLSNTTSKSSVKKSNVTSNKSNNTASNKTSNTTTKVTGNFNEVEAKKLLSLVNEVRKENGLKEVTWNTSLEVSAKTRAKETNTKFDHTRPNGSKYNTAITTKYKTSGENIAAGQSNATEVFNSWMNSAGHKKNILSPNFTQMGVAVYYDANSTYQYYWTQLFIG